VDGSWIEALRLDVRRGGAGALLPDGLARVRTAPELVDGGGLLQPLRSAVDSRLRIGNRPARLVEPAGVSRAAGEHQSKPVSGELTSLIRNGAGARRKS